MSKKRPSADIPAALPSAVRDRVQPPVVVVLGSPGDVVRLLTQLPATEAVCYQMDLYPAARLREKLDESGLTGAQIVTAADLWDHVPPNAATVIYPAERGSERDLKIDMVEQAFHVLRPGGTLVVNSEYEKDAFFPTLLKKVFGRVHTPAEGGGAVLWCERPEKDRPRRRHELTFHGRIGEGPSLKFLSRPGVFSYGRFDEGSRAILEVALIEPGDRVLDIGCGVGTNGVHAAQQAGPKGGAMMIDSNLRAVTLAEHNARLNDLANCTAVAALIGSGEEKIEEGKFDVALVNPPYYAQASIARGFIEAGHRSLRTGGRFYLVTKQPHQVEETVAEVFGEADVLLQRGYHVFCAVAGT